MNLFDISIEISRVRKQHTESFIVPVEDVRREKEHEEEETGEEEAGDKTPGKKKKNNNQ